MSTGDDYTLSLADERATLQKVGGKGTSLANMMRAGLPVPDGFHVTTSAYRAFVEMNDLESGILAALDAVDPEKLASVETASHTIAALFTQAEIPLEVASAIANAYGDLSSPDPVVAVRSSATAEDLPDASFAGQQETYLNIEGTEAVLNAVKRCWASLWTARAIGYRARRNIGVEGIALAVVVQRLVPAEAAGVLFTANPINGRRDQTLINAAWGLGEAVVGGEVTPDTYTIDKETGEVLAWEIAEKVVMTVRVDGGTETKPVPDGLRRAPVLDDAQAAELAQLGVQIEALYSDPRDIEWALADGDVFVLQARPITALTDADAPREIAEPDVPPPMEWEVPNPRAKYMRNNIVELMADPLTPLFATLGRRIINRSMHHTLDEALGSSDILVGEIIVTVHGYAYYKGEFTAGQILRLLANSIGIMRRMFTGMETRWLDARKRYTEMVQTWDARAWHTLPMEELLEGVSEVFGMAIEYYMALVSGVIPAAWMTEALFTYIYKAIIKRRDDPGAATYLLGFDSKPIQAEKALYDLAQWVKQHADLKEYLLQLPANQFDAENVEVEIEVWAAWQARFVDYLTHYGGTLYDLDFSQPTPADDPTPVAQTLKLFLRDQGQNPYKRQEAATRRREQATQAMLDRLKGLRRRWFRSTLRRAQTNAPRREDGLADIGLGYPLVRAMLLEAGHRLVQAGTIRQADDIFWLMEDEVEQTNRSLAQGAFVKSMSEWVKVRKALWRAQKRITPPASLPLPPRWVRRWLPAQFGVDVTPEATSSVIKGIACSAGSVTGPARVLRGPEDFDRMQYGEVLVAAITTPAWTPLFAMASGIVTDVGGPLSHGSIVAREYGIPAVLGTGVATHRIRNGQTITVDGFEGTVRLEEAQANP